LLRRAVRAVGFGGLLDLREVQVGAHLRARVAGAEERREDRVDALLRVVLDLLHILELARVEAGSGRGLGQQVAVLVDDRHVLGRHVGHAGRHHPRDRLHLALVEHAARVEVDEHRRRRRFLVAHEHRRLRDREMHARAAHGVDRLDGALQLAFERALVVDLLGELADAELLVVHQLEADRAALRQALARETQTRFMNLLGRHENGAAAVRQLVRNVALLERGNDCAAVPVGEIGKQHAIVRLARPHDEARHHHHHNRDGHDERHARIRAELVEHRHALREAAEVGSRAAREARAGGGRSGCARLCARQAHSGVGRDE
jgi:hypothetical protein